MDWKGILGIALACLFAGLLSGLVLGARGCEGESITKLLQENAELKSDVTRYRFLAKQAEDERAKHAGRRHTAERAAAAIAAKEAAANDRIKRLRRRMVQAGHKADERDELIAELDRDRNAKAEQINWLQAALDASKAETTSAIEAEHALNKALVASEERADKLEAHATKGRKQKILIGVGSAIGGAGVMALGVWGAGQL